LEELLGYFETWSAVQHYKKANDQNPVSLVEKRTSENLGSRTYKESSIPDIVKGSKSRKIIKGRMKKKHQKYFDVKKGNI
jgi:hypothetical protein